MLTKKDRNLLTLTLTLTLTAILVSSMCFAMAAFSQPFNIKNILIIVLTTAVVYPTFRFITKHI
jgi:hypothetical protein